jgi:hypothetical protein
MQPTCVYSRIQGDETRDRKGGRTPKDNPLVPEHRAPRHLNLRFWRECRELSDCNVDFVTPDRTRRPPKIVHLHDGTAADAGRPLAIIVAHCLTTD